MTLRPFAALLAVALACTMTACGGSEESTEADSSSESPAAEPEATGEDYATLATTLFEQTTGEGATTAEEINEQSEFPEGVSVQEFEQESQTVCIEDASLDIGLRFVASAEQGGLTLLEGLCDGGEGSLRDRAR